MQASRKWGIRETIMKGTTTEVDAVVSRRVPRWAILRGALGVGQILGTTVTLVTLVRDGVTAPALGATVVTCLLTTTSVLLFGRKQPRTANRDE
jgi:hypothetical protein